MTEDATLHRSTAASRAADAGPADGGKGMKTRKRTKTGCLTCRKRRIKCDEGRPTCHNCYKSKRQCEGYQPTRSPFRANGNNEDFAASSLTYPFVDQMSDFRQVYTTNPGPFANILPRPLQDNAGHRHSYASQDPTHWMQSPLSATPDGAFSQAQLSELVAAQTNVPASAPAYMASFPDAVLAGHFTQSPLYANMPDLMGRSHPLPQHTSDPVFSPTSNGPAGQHLPETFNLGMPNPISSDGHVWNPDMQSYDSNLYSTVPAEHFDFTETILEEELYDVGSDDEGVDALERMDQTGLPRMMSVHGNFDVKALRTHDTFLNTPNILVNYEPQWEASPLMDPTTARIFGHFIAVTACHLSLGQRRASNPSLLFQPRAVPKSDQGLWTYILPQKALSNQGLMHAMLALASLQIAMLQGTDRHTARKHYHFAIRRNHKSVASPKKRTAIATIATTLLLACFEVWAADHSNWNSHLIGARQLLVEADFVRKVRQIKRNRLTVSPAMNPDDPYAIYLHQKSGPVLQAELPNEEFLEKLMGYKVPYGDNVLDPAGSLPMPPLTQIDIDVHDNYADLFWFYVKQDIYYSTISSNALLLPFERWGDCPPRAPIGRLDAIYGTSDHLMLIYGRIATFINQDLQRKKKAVAANGGRWVPPPSMFSGGNGSPSGFPGRPPASRAGTATPNGKPGPPSPQGPSFMGMIPDPPTPRLPSVFRETAGDYINMPTKREQEEVGNLEQAFGRALGEWNGLQAALAAFEAELQAAEWQPLPFNAAVPIATHFGSALQYGDYRIADIWAMFYTAKIVLARVHPAMPPAALMAAGVCAAQTAEWANTIGKIIFGMQTPKDNEPLNPTFASVLTQNMYTLFFAGVQFREPAQRLVTIQRLQYIAEKVGHESSALIAAALETCWINSFRIGSGPEWRRTLGLRVDATRDEHRSTEFRTMERKKEGATVYIRGDDKTRTNFGMGIMSLESDFAKKLNVV